MADEQSLEVSYRIIEGFDDEFAQNIIAHPELHFHAANQAEAILTRRRPYCDVSIC